MLLLWFMTPHLTIWNILCHAHQASCRGGLAALRRHSSADRRDRRVTCDVTARDTAWVGVTCLLLLPAMASKAHDGNSYKTSLPTYHEPDDDDSKAAAMSSRRWTTLLAFVASLFVVFLTWPANASQPVVVNDPPRQQTPAGGRARHQRTASSEKDC